MTPIQLYEGIYVKREDLCFDPPAPPFSKCRGIILHLLKLKKQGVTTVGYTETSISMAGWGLAWACKELGLKLVIFDPQYKETPPTLAYHREQWKKFNVIIEPIPAGMAKVNLYISQKILFSKYDSCVHLPLGLPFPETIEATKEEVWKTLRGSTIRFKTIVVCVGSGTICAGILKALGNWTYKYNVIGVMTRTGNIEEKKKRIQEKAGFMNGFFKPNLNFQLIDPGWEYTDKSLIQVPFPCHEYYDAKAWQWLTENKNTLKAPILFWNIGH